MRVFLTAPSYDLPRKTYGLQGDADIGYGPPLGLAYLAAVLRDGGHEVMIFDPGATRGEEAPFVAAAQAFQPDVIGISIISCLYGQAVTLAQALRQAMPGIPIMAGGPHCTIHLRKALEDCPDIDISVGGEAEDRILDIVAGACAPERLRTIPGICHRDNDTIHQTPPRGKPAPMDLDHLPLPARDLLDVHIGRNQPYQREYVRSTWVVTSRGCPYGRCTFCYYAHERAPGYRQRSVAGVVAELEMLVREQGFQHISFLDEDFIGNREWVSQLCGEILDRGLKFDWYCETRVSTVTPQLLALMRRAGCYLIYYGIESGSPEMLRVIRKGITMSQARNAIRMTREAGIQTVCSFILGLPMETPAQGRQTIQASLELDPDYAAFHFFHPTSGLPILQLAREHGTLLAVDHPNFAGVNYVPKAYASKEAVERMLASAYRRFYMRPRYILRRARQIRDWNDLKWQMMGAMIVASRTRGILRFAARVGTRLATHLIGMAPPGRPTSGSVDRRPSP